MAVNRRYMPYEASAIFSVLRDGRSYARWVVGTSEIRDVDDGWPEPGSRLHYRVGWGPTKKDDETKVVRLEDGSELELEAVGRPLGTARVDFRLDAVRDGSMVTIIEHPTKGLLRTLHNPGFELLIYVRNVETLRRLEREVRRRQGAAVA
ncbi:MAG: SRPBCC family protein [Acidothermaceae bacterium]